MTVNLAGARVAVVGATGFIGSHLTERLAEEGAEVLAIAKTTKRLSNLRGVHSRVRFQTVDICDAAATKDVLTAFRPQALFHLASHPDAVESFEQMRTCLRSNAEAVIGLLEGAHAAAVETVVIVDSSKVYGNSDQPYSEDCPDLPICSYAIAKAAAWRFCKLYSALHPGAHVVSVRPTLVYGRRQNVNLISYVADCIGKGLPVRVQGGWQTRDPLYIDDAVEALVRAAVSIDARGHSIPVGGGQELTVSAICQAVVHAMGSEIEVELGVDTPRSTEIWRSACDNSGAAKYLGWRPKTNLAEGLAALLSAKPLSLTAYAGHGGHVGDSDGGHSR